MGEPGGQPSFELATLTRDNASRVAPLCHVTVANRRSAQAVLVEEDGAIVAGSGLRSIVGRIERFFPRGRWDQREVLAELPAGWGTRAARRCTAGGVTAEGVTGTFRIRVFGDVERVSYESCVALRREGQRTKTVLDGDGDPLQTLALSRDGAYLAAGYGQEPTCHPGRLMLWSLELGKRGPPQVVAERRLVERACVSAAHFSADGRWLVAQCRASGSGRRGVRIWEVGTAALASELTTSHDALSPDGALQAVADDATLRLCAVSSGTVLVAHQVHDEHIIDVAFSTDGTFLVTLGYDGRIWVYGIGAA